MRRHILVDRRPEFPPLRLVATNARSAEPCFGWLPALAMRYRANVFDLEAMFWVLSHVGSMRHSYPLF